MRAILRVTIASVVVACVLAISAQAQTLSEELHRIEVLSAGVKTPFAEVERKGLDLLQQYKDAESQGKIYFTLAATYAQSGPVVDKTIEYARKALACPLDAQKRLRLYGYWGDAIQVAHAGVTGEQLVAARREAAMPYLQGLKEALQYNLPDEAPEIPRGAHNIIARGIITEDTERMQRQEAARAKAFEIAVRQNKLIRERETMIGQVAFMYSRMPFATEEIRALATKILEDEEAVNQLMRTVEEAVNKRAKEFVGGDIDAREILSDFWQKDGAKAPPKIAEAPPQGKTVSPRGPISQGSPREEISATARRFSVRWLLLLLACGIGSAIVLYIIFRRKGSGVKQ